jgi:hypothetical protein
LKEKEAKRTSDFGYCYAFQGAWQLREFEVLRQAFFQESGAKRTSNSHWDIANPAFVSVMKIGLIKK